MSNWTHDEKYWDEIEAILTKKMKRPYTEKGEIEIKNIFSHVKPVKDNEYSAFAKRIFEIENDRFFQYFILAFREEMINLISLGTSGIEAIRTVDQMTRKMGLISTAYLEAEAKNDEL